MFKIALRVLICLSVILFSYHIEFKATQASKIEGASKVRLSWSAVPDAVMYEFIVISKSSDKGRKTLKTETIITYSDIYAPGVEVELATINADPKTLWWQVRALNSDKKPISSFSSPRRLNDGEPDPSSPLATARLESFPAAKLYQAYSWIPVLGADSYEVQILSAKQMDHTPEVIKSLTVSGGRSFDLYDETAYTQEGAYWWRVQAKDSSGNPVGNWSEALPFTVKHGGFKVAAFGDSITHGGGAISNPPSDPAYDWTTYTGFPVKNLGHSGDTTSMMNTRFEKEVLPFAPKLLVVMGGINDLRGGAAAEDVINNLREIKEKCQEHGITPIFATVTPVNPDVIKKVFNQETEASWQSERIKVNNWIKDQEFYVDVAPLLTGPDGLLPHLAAADGLHPDTKGKAQIGKKIGRYLKKNFGENI
ncbi:GDSL-type esterase/lipase family protein [Dendrosporobacter sp. 1207_IL3150]|uniref:GDSL-type esterase/lipase family protein n=1 Tax=Dendrosporobacter sp. 1207_IL3150 TaxID=3084054 RepID=UPI002FD8C2BD